MGKAAKKELNSFCNTEAANVRKVWSYCRTLIKAKPLSREEGIRMHELLLNCILNHENNMARAGIPIPDNYREHHVKKPWEMGESVKAQYVPCKRCELSKRMDDGNFRCTEFYCGPKREIYVVGDDDGCSRGILKEHYR